MTVETASPKLFSPLLGVSILAPISSQSSYDSGTSQAHILTKSALSFVVLLHRAFNSSRKALLEDRQKVQDALDAGQTLRFLQDTELQRIRDDPTWTGPVPGPGLADRRTEITGPPERKMIINALNTSVRTYMSDFEDSCAPTWENILDGQLHLYDAVRHQIDFHSGQNGKSYAVSRNGRHVPVLMVRPRGWHMEEKHITVDGEPISASLFDFGVFFFHNARKLIENGAGPFFYLPKLEGHLEARVWNSVFNVAQDALNIPRGTIRATVLIETLPAAYQMEEIIYELRQHLAGLNCGRWDYLFLIAKRLRKDASKVLPDRHQVTMTVPFMQAYCQRLVNICHRRQVHAMGGMAAQIPVKNDPAANDAAIAKVHSDKLREASMGHDGTWVAHPALAAVANAVFDEHMPTPNQIHIIPPVSVSEEDLSNTAIAGAKITTAGIRENIYIALCYMESWLRGTGCVPINSLMEDAATAEVSRVQLHLWVQHKVTLADTGLTVTPELVTQLLAAETKRLSALGGPENRFRVAAEYLREQACGNELAEFLTTLLYDEIVLEKHEVAVESLLS